jgi:hypothetical protein
MARTRAVIADDDAAALDRLVRERMGSAKLTAPETLAVRRRSLAMVMAATLVAGVLQCVGG